METLELADYSDSSILRFNVQYPDYHQVMQGELDNDILVEVLEGPSSAVIHILIILFIFIY